jgi:hypothetical protein
MKVIPLPEFLPDQPAHNNPGLVVCENVIPRTAGSYGPFLSLAAYAGATSHRCQGAFTARDSAGNILIFQGDQLRLRLLTSASQNFSDVSRASGGQYATTADDMWRFAQYGNMIVATNYADDPQGYLIGSSSAFSQLASGAPRAKYVAIWRDFLVLGNLTTDPQGVHWSAQDNPASFPTIGSTAAAQAQSDRQTLAGDGGWVQGLVGGLGNADGVVIQERALWRVTYIQPPAIFAFDLVEGARGTPAPGSIVQLGGVVAYLGEDGFYLFDGQSSRPIGNEKVDKTFFADLDQSNLSRMSSAVDPINKIFYWAYPGAGNTLGVPNRVIAYNWSLDRWSFIQFPDGIELIFRAGTFGYAADNADSLGYTVDTSPYGPDSRFWAGAKSILAGFDNSHRMGFFSGPALAATLETGDLDLNGGRFASVTGIRPIADTASITAAIGYRNDQADGVAYTSATAPMRDGFCPQYISARYPRARLSIPAGATWSHVSGYEPRLRQSGKQ